MVVVNETRLTTKAGWSQNGLEGTNSRLDYFCWFRVSYVAVLHPLQFLPVTDSVLLPHK